MSVIRDKLFYQECQWLDFPPMQPCHQKSEFLYFMNRNKAEAYKKKKLKDSELRSKTPPPTVEMEVDGEKSLKLCLKSRETPLMPEIKQADVQMVCYLPLNQKSAGLVPGIRVFIMSLSEMTS